MDSQSEGFLRIAIDGPAGAGKSTVAKQLARRLGIMYIDTGAMYRAVAWMALHHGLKPTDVTDIVALLQNAPPQFQRGTDGTMEIIWNDRRLFDELRSPDVSDTVSQLSVHADIRDLLTNWQQAFGKEHSVVMDGRDIGTVVLPDAELKIFLTADLNARAQRRASEFEQQGIAVSTEVLSSSLSERDARDANRPVAPLREALDAHRIDTTYLTVDQVVETILQLVGEEAR